MDIACASRKAGALIPSNGCLLLNISLRMEEIMEHSALGCPYNPAIRIKCDLVLNVWRDQSHIFRKGLDVFNRHKGMRIKRGRYGYFMQ